MSAGLPLRAFRQGQTESTLVTPLIWLDGLARLPDVRIEAAERVLDGGHDFMQGKVPAPKRLWQELVMLLVARALQLQRSILDSVTIGYNEEVEPAARGMASTIATRERRLDLERMLREVFGTSEPTARLERDTLERRRARASVGSALGLRRCALQLRGVLSHGRADRARRCVRPQVPP